MTKGVFREVVIEFGDNQYTVTPSNKLLRKIDAELSPQSLFGVLSSLGGQSNVPLPALALIIQQLLNSGGGNFTEDDILVELLNDVQSNNGNGIRPLVEAIAQCLAVEGVSEKNSASPSQGGGAKDTSGRAKRKKAQ